MATWPMAIAGLDPLVSVGAVLLVIFGALSWLTRRLQGGPGIARGAPGRLSIRLTAEHAVHVVEVGGSRLLIGTGPGGAPRLISQLEGPAPKVSEVSETRGAVGV
jgi:flagellar biogenesis protein FliO